ncbi:MAG TPA: Ig-like domain-containing protein [Rubrivivax sp.]|nr:Ig-like domain-containing protein [Rubrivivax sp.]
MSDWKRLLAVLVTLGLAACGGGGGNAGTPGLGGGGSGTAVAAGLTLTLNSASIDNSGSRTVTATATAVDANRNAVAGIPVQFAISDPQTSAFIVSNGSQTDAGGQVTGTVSIGPDRTNRPVTVKAISGDFRAEAVFNVTGTQFAQASAVPSVVSAGAAGTVQYTLADVNGNPMAGVPITVSGSGVGSQSGATNQNGGYTFNYTAPSTPGTSLTINAQAGGAESNVNVTIPGGSTTVPKATEPVSKTLNLSANVVAVNTGSTSNQISISAIFRDGTNAPISNVRVLFGVSGDNGTGSIGSAGNAVLSDASGTASTTYKPGAVSSPTNGVTIRACWKTSDFAPGETIANCPAGNLLTTSLTIVSNPVSISIGTDNTITDGATNLTYIKRFVVLVVDSAGNPKSDVQVTPSVDLGGFAKGQYEVKTGGCGTADCWVQVPTAICPNEDLNRNGVIDTGEDVNGNGQMDPRKSDVSITLSGAAKTDANGVAVLQLEYPKSVGSWVNFKITVTAAGVLSPPAYYLSGAPVLLPSRPLGELSGANGQPTVGEYLASYLWLPVPNAEILNVSQDPSFKVSPYGTAPDCTSPN